METFLSIDYPTWWYLIVGGLFSGYAILDGFDFGAGAWHLFFNKEESRRIALNAIGPVWDGNEVWLVIGGGALFAGFPILYATLFSAMNTPFMLFLTFIILRAVSIEFRSKEPMMWWRKMWDTVYSISSAMLAILLGVVLGNVLQGLPIGENNEYKGNALLDFLTPYPILVGLTTLALFMTHGAIYLLLKTEGRLFAKLQILVKRGIIFLLVTFGITSMYTLVFIPHLTDGLKENQWLFAVPIMMLLSVANIPRLVNRRKFNLAFVFSSLTIALLLIVVAMELYPVILTSTISSEYNITIYNACSSQKSLGIMLVIAAIGTPLVLGYTIFVYKTFRGKVKIDEHSY
ncbi:MAG: hypothetical protein RL226_183 [Bacteroidota bacterium]